MKTPEQIIAELQKMKEKIRVEKSDNKTPEGIFFDEALMKWCDELIEFIRRPMLDESPGLTKPQVQQVSRAAASYMHRRF